MLSISGWRASRKYSFAMSQTQQNALAMDILFQSRLPASIESGLKDLAPELGGIT